jgi:hypothetical protein
MTMALVPPTADALAAVPDPVFKRLSTVKDMTQPAPAGQLIGAAVTGLPVTLTNIRSAGVPLVLLNSVIGEQATLAVVIVGPRTVAVSMTPVSTAVYHIALNELAPTEWVPHAYKNPVPTPEVL